MHPPFVVDIKKIRAWARAEACELIELRQIGGLLRAEPAAGNGVGQSQPENGDAGGRDVEHRVGAFTAGEMRCFGRKGRADIEDGDFRQVFVSFCCLLCVGHGARPRLSAHTPERGDNYGIAQAEQVGSALTVSPVGHQYFWTMQLTRSGCWGVMDFRAAEARGTRDWALDAPWSLNGPSWLVDTMAMVHIAPTDVVEQLVFGCAFVKSRLPVDLNREGRERFEDLWALHPAVFYAEQFPSVGCFIKWKAA